MIKKSPNILLDLGNAAVALNLIDLKNSYLENIPIKKRIHSLQSLAYMLVIMALNIVIVRIFKRSKANSFFYFIFVFFLCAFEGGGAFMLIEEGLFRDYITNAFFALASNIFFPLYIIKKLIIDKSEN